MMSDDRSARVAAVHAAVDSALRHAKATGEPTPQHVIDYLKAKVAALDTGGLDALKGKIMVLAKKPA
jgi:hypothetical protein